MRIVADENIVAVDSYFSGFGELVKLPGREITAADVKEADALLVRSITRVDEALLAGSNVRFVATATSGTDHLDLDWLQQAGIAVHDAAGCNANAVVEYVLAAVAALIQQGKFLPQQPLVGVVGAGHVGSRLLKLFRKIGFPCVATDPFLDENAKQQLQAIGVEFGTLESVLAADIVSLHTPITRTGPHPTFHLLNVSTFGLLKPGALLINAARGEVVDNAALFQLLAGDNAGLLTVFDVWENEPDIHAGLCQLVDIATPHIAGYSVQAKTSASAVNYQAFLQHFGLQGSQAEAGKTEAGAGISRDSLKQLDRAAVAEIVQAFPVSDVSDSFKASVSTGQAALQFDSMRRQLASRQEFLA